MNERLARVLASRLLPLYRGDVNFLSVVAGLTRPLETDSFSNGKKMQIVPVPLTRLDNTESGEPVLVSTPLAEPDDWSALLPDAAKNAIAYFENGGSTGRIIGGFTQIRSRLTLVVWFNGTNLLGVDRESMTTLLLKTLMGTSRNIPAAEPGLSNLQLTGWSYSTIDPFAKYSAYSDLFNFRNSPYGYVALDLSLTAYLDSSCLIN